MSEESSMPNRSFSKEIKEWLWILDPLDGTKDFIQGTGNYAMHLALNYNNKPYLGVVLIPEKMNYGSQMEKKSGVKEVMDLIR